MEETLKFFAILGMTIFVYCLVAISEAITKRIAKSNSDLEQRITLLEIRNRELVEKFEILADIEYEKRKRSVDSDGELTEEAKEWLQSNSQ